MQYQNSEYQPKIGLVSLGCPKATSDSEHIITRLRAEGYALSSDYHNADAVIVNTCGFLDSARAESLDAIGEALKENGKVIVTGCLGKDKEFIEKHHKNIIAITGPQAFENVMYAVHKTVKPKHEPYENLVPESGLRLTPRHYAYLKISEGCDNKCSFCIIPSMRGKLVSRPVNQVIAEAERLKRAGVKELLVISQDTGAYGRDIKYQSFDYRGKTYKTKFYDLCKALGEVGIWVRLHYVYPYPHIGDVLSLMKSGHILPYLDLPLQHFSTDILTKMRRPGNTQKTLDMLQKWQEIVPELTLRSTFIVGFPGETDKDFNILIDNLKKAKINHAGCFIYEPVKGAKANNLENHIAPEIAKERYDIFMKTQQEISSDLLKNKIGKTIPVILDDFDNEIWIGRTMGDAPEIDGNIFVNSNTPHDIGDIIQVEVTQSSEYDLYGNASIVQENRVLDFQEH